MGSALSQAQEGNGVVKTEVASSPEAEYDPADVKAAVKEEGAGDASVKLETTRSESHSVKTEAEEEEEEENEDEEETEVAAAPAEVVDEDAYIVRPRRCRRLQKGNSVLINDTSAIGNFYPGFFRDSFGILSGFFRNSFGILLGLWDRLRIAHQIQVSAIKDDVIVIVDMKEIQPEMNSNRK